ncbi:glycosyltransferase [Flavobacterium sp.]|uniref:glycosyltransferase n=1 Tax=Flavobacterium sp. TaxID=239 RepID=UPI003752310D
MKILLIGEYSRLHNSLKEGLIKLGHEVVIYGFNDGFKNFNVDLKFEKKFDSGFSKKIKLLLLKITKFDISSYFTYHQFYKNRNKFKNFDVVQLINENSFFCNFYYEKKILNFIFKNNKKVFLLSCGDDYLYVNYNFDNPENKSIVQPYLRGTINNKDFSNVLKFKTKDFKKLHDFIFENIKGVIASDIDYHIPLVNHPKYLGLIANPINIDSFVKNELIINDEIIIFHGINESNYFKKGNDFFEKALKIIKNKYHDKVEIIIVKSLPYNDYIKLYNNAHIILDQVYAFDQGYNALEAMAKGKAVFTGAENEFEEYYNLKEKVAINALPSVDYLVNQMSFLIENPNEIIAIGKRARDFIEKEHNYKVIAEKYIEKWEK